MTSPVETSPQASDGGRDRSEKSGVISGDDALRFLVRAGEALSRSLDYRNTLSALTELAVPAIADWCAVDLLDEAGRLQRLAVAHRDPSKIQLVRDIEAQYPEPPTSPSGSHARLQARRTDLIEEITDEMLSAAARDGEHLRMIRSLGLRSFLSVPLIVDDAPAGLLTVVTAESGRRYSPKDVEVVDELARRAATAIGHARSHARVLQANAELAEAERFAAGIVQSITDPMTVYDAEWRVRYQNDAAVRIFSRTGRTESMLGRQLFVEFPDLIGTAFEVNMRRAMERQEPTTFTEQRRATGRWAEVNCYPLPGGGIAAVWRDITDQKRAEQTLGYLARANDALAASLDYNATIEALAQLIVPELADWCSVSVLEAGMIRMVAVAHADPEKVRMVRELETRYPSTPDSPSQAARVIRTGVPSIVAEITDDMIDRVIDDPEHRALLRQLGFRSIMTVPMANGDRVLGAMSLGNIGAARPAFSEADLGLATELARRAAIAVDHARLYREAIDARAAAEEANDTKMGFLARMSHELRTPLNAIGGYTDLLAMGIRGPITTAQAADLARISRSQQHLLSLINDILNYAKVEAGRVHYNVKPIAVRDAITTVEQLFVPQFRQRGLPLTVVPVPDDVVASADGEKVQQILMNLVSNALKFTPSGSVTISAERADGHVRVRVVDTGVGMPGEKLDEIFEPFVQLSRPGELSQGTGLGLAISRDLARGMGGDLTADSVEGQGSVFVLTLLAAG